MSETFEHLRVERTGHIARVTFNRPRKANALNHAHLAEIEAAALSFRDDAETRVVIFTGAGKNFSSGADLTERAPAESILMRRRTLRIGERAVKGERPSAPGSAGSGQEPSRRVALGSLPGESAVRLGHHDEADLAELVELLSKSRPTHK